MRRQGENQALPKAAAKAVELIDIERIRADIERLCRSPRHSVTDPVGHREAAIYVSEALGDAECSVEQQGFTIPSEPDPRPGLNIVGTLVANRKLEPPGLVSSVASGGASGVASGATLVSAHYDTVPGSPGADDNASGVAVMLECARVLSTIERTRPTLFVAFDAEERQPEVGLHGSTAYVRELESASNASGISAVYILEMVGYSAPEGGQLVPPGLQLVFPRAFDRLANSRFKGDSVVAISNWKSRDTARKLEKAAGIVSGGVPILPIEVPRWMPIPHNLRRSDHAPFWKAGIPAVMIGDTANFRNPNYHAETDTPETLDYEFIGSVARTLVAAVATEVTGVIPVRKPRVKLR